MSRRGAPAPHPGPAGRELPGGSPFGPPHEPPLAPRLAPRHEPPHEPRHEPPDEAPRERRHRHRGEPPGDRPPAPHRRGGASPIWRAAAGAALLGALAASAPAAGPALPLDAVTDEPRAYGYRVGDVVARRIRIDVPEGLVLDAASVPQPGARGKPIELRSVARRSEAAPGGRRIDLTLEYQLFSSPPQVRTLELPTVTLQFKGRPRDQSLRIEAWPVTLAPLVPVEVSPRRGLGELQPDAPAPPIDTAAVRQRLVGYGALALVLLALLAEVYFGAPWRARAQRPFAQAWRGVRRLTPASGAPAWREATRSLHRALDRTAGEVVFAHGIDRLIAAQPRFAPLRDDFTTFFEHSRSEFFETPRSESFETPRGAPSERPRRAPSERAHSESFERPRPESLANPPPDPATSSAAAGPGADRRWLAGFARRCRNAERGTA